MVRTAPLLTSPPVVAHVSIDQPGSLKSDWEPIRAELRLTSRVVPMDSVPQHQMNTRDVQGQNVYTYVLHTSSLDLIVKVDPLEHLVTGHA